MSTPGFNERRQGERRQQFGRRREDLTIPPTTDYSLAARRRRIEMGTRIQAIALRGIAEIEAKISRGEPCDMTGEEVKDLLALALHLTEQEDRPI